MTKDELIAKLQEIENTGGDTEHDHYVADKALIEYINDSGIKEAYEVIDKWYA